MKRVILGTRGSRLALAQAELVKQALERLPERPEIRVQIIRTTGDQRLDISLSQSGPKIGQGLFTKELEEALLSRADRCGGSLSERSADRTPSGTRVGGHLTTARSSGCPDLEVCEIPERNSSGGLLRPAALAGLASYWLIGRIFSVSDIRGNVPTRIAKLLAEESLNSLVLAKAGLERLGYSLESGRLEFDAHWLFASDLREILPAPGQGAIGLEIRANDSELREFLGGINDLPTWFCTGVEREFLRLLGGGCNLPLGIRTSLKGSELRCEAIIFDETEKPGPELYRANLRRPRRLPPRS